MKKNKCKMKLTIEMGDDGVFRETITRNGNLTEEEENKFWENVKESNKELPFDSELRKAFDEVFHF